MAGAGFIRKYTYFPATEEIAAIEGVVIVDQRSPGPIRGASYGVVAVVGECTDMSKCCTVNTSGEVVSKFDIQEVYGGSDLLDKIGPFDRYLGKFGAEMGNLFVELRNKRFSRLVVVPVDLVRQGSGTQYGIRIWRQLPTNTSATSTTPIVAVVPARVWAGTQFYNGSNYLKLAQSVDFTGSSPKSSGVDGTTVTSGLPAATVTITRAAGSFVSDGVVEGDAVVPGSLNAAALSQNLLCAGAGTLRVVSVNANGLEITVQKQNGTNFTTSDWEAGSALAYRVHKGSDADSGPLNQFSEAAGYTVLARPTVATISSGSALTPSPAPTAASGTYWNELSGLAGYTHPSGALTYDADLHAANPSTTSDMRARYLEAINALLNDAYPMNEVSIVTAARKDPTIQSYLYNHVLTSTSRGMSRCAIVSPTLTTQTIAAVLASAAPGVGGTGGAVRNERVWYSWPGCRTFIPEAVGYSIANADGTSDDEGILDVTMDTWLACLLSNLQPELNPGQASDPVPQIFAPIIGYQRGAPSPDMESYKLFKQYGVAALRMDRVVGPIIQSGVTTSLTSGETTINRRRMADFIQDTMAARGNQLNKRLLRESLKDAILSEFDAFLGDLLSENNPEAQRIHSYSLDDKTLNTPALQARGIHVVKTKVRMLSTLDDLVLATEIGQDTVTTSVV